MPKSRLSSKWLVLLAGSLVTVAALSGCDRSDAASAELRKAKNVLDTMRVGGVALAQSIDKVRDGAAKDNEKALKTVMDDMTKLGSSNSPGASPAAKILQARASAGLAELAVQPVSAIEASAQNLGELIRRNIETYSDSSARAAALGAYSPDKDNQTIDAAIKDAEAQIAKAQDAKRAAEQKLAQLEKQAADLLNQGKARRAQAAELKNRATKMTATQALPLVEEASKIGRGADGLERQAADLQADADGQKPLVAAAEEQVKSATSLRDQFRVSREQIKARADLTKAQAAESKASADAAAKAIAESAAELEKLRGEIDGFTVAGKDPLELYRAAVKATTEAGKALGTDVSGAVSTSLASYQQKLGDAMMSRARGVTLQKEVFALLSAAQPALPDRANYETKAVALREAAEKAINDAKDAYEAAKTGFEKGGSKGDEAFQKLYAEKVVKPLEALSKRAGDPEKPTDAEPAPAPKGNAGKDSAKAPAAADDATVAAVRAAVAKASLVMKEGRFNDFVPLVLPEQRPMAEMMMTPMFVASLDDACREKFSKSLFDVVKPGPDNPGAMMLGMFAMGIDQIKQSRKELADFKPEDVKINLVSPTLAQVSGVGTEMFEMVLKDGAWLMKFPGMEAMPSMPAAGGPESAMLKKVGEGFAGVTADLKAGKFATSDDLAKAVNAILKGMVPKLPPPPGGG